MKFDTLNTRRMEGALSNDAKIKQTGYYFQGHKQSSNNDHGIDLESNVQLNGLGVIR